MADRAEAWLIELRDGRVAAIGQHELAHVLDELPPVRSVPGTAAPCSEVFVWENRPLPLADLASGVPAVGAGELFAIVAVGGERDAPRHAALRIAGVPRKISVNDADAAGPQEVPPDLRALSHAAFSAGGLVVPVLDLPTVFAGKR